MEILNSVEIVTRDVPSWAMWFCSIGFIGLIVFLLSSMTLAWDDAEGPAVVFFILCIICGVLLGIGAYTTSKCEDYGTGRYKYEVVLSEDYSAQELYDKYDVIERRGNIWVIEDKEVK